MARTKFNHKRRIKDVQPAKLKGIYPGTIIQFKYKGDNVFDRLPLVLVLWNDWVGGYKIHGINFNYLNETVIKQVLAEMVEKNPIVTEDQDAVDDYDDALPYRNMLKDPYTRIQLPTYKHERGGNPLSKSEAMTQMNRLYEKKLRKIVQKHDIYRTYFISKMSSPLAITYDIEGLVK